MKKKTIAKKSLQPVPSQGMVEQAKKHGGFRPQLGNYGYTFKTPESKVSEERLIKDIIK